MPFTPFTPHSSKHSGKHCQGRFLGHSDIIAKSISRRMSVILAYASTPCTDFKIRVNRIDRPFKAFAEEIFKDEIPYRRFVFTGADYRYSPRIKKEIEILDRHSRTPLNNFLQRFTGVRDAEPLCYRYYLLFTLEDFINYGRVGKG